MNLSKYFFEFYANQRSLRLLVCGFLISVFPVSGEFVRNSGDYFFKNSGSFGFEFRQFFQDPLFDGQHNQWSKFEGREDFSIHNVNRWGLRINSRFLFSFEDESLDFLHPDNIYAYYEPKGLKLRAGTQIFSWSLGKGARPADFLNQTYKLVNVMTPPKEGELSLDLAYDFGSDSTHWIELVYLPCFTPSKYPDKNSRYYIFADPNKRRFFLEDTTDFFQDSMKRWRPQGAVRWHSRVMDNLSFSLFYFNGYDKLPGLVQVSNYRGIILEHRLVHLTGLNLKYGGDNWGLHTELVRNGHQKKIRDWNNDKKFVDMVSVRPYYHFLLGAEYRLRAITDWLIMLEVFGDTDQDREPEDIDQFKPLRNCVYFRIEKAPFQSSARKISAGYFMDYRSYDGLLQISYTEKVFEHFSLRANYEEVLINNTGTEPFSSHLKPLRTTRRLSAEALLVF